MSKTRGCVPITRALLALALATCLGGATSLVIGGSAASAADATTSACPTYNPPNTLTLAGGTPQSAKLGAAFNTNLEVTLVNSNGCPITTPLAGIAVTFVAPSSGPTGTFSSSGANAVLVGTNAAGSASAPQFTANTLPGGYQVVASSDYGSVSFSLVNTGAGIPATISPSPPSQTATVGNRYGRPLQVQVLDANGNPVVGANVAFALGSATGGAGGASSSAGASFRGGASQAGELTNSSGIAISPLFTANTVAGKFTATATIAGITEPAGFQLDNLTVKPPTITTVKPAKQSTTVAASFNKPLQATVVNGSGRPVPGATVTFTLGSSGGGAGGSGSSTGTPGASFVGGSTQATETTNDAGVASSPRFTANTVGGAFGATATTTGTTKATNFALRNLPARPATITAGVAATESTAVGTRFPIRLAVTVKDKYGNSVPGVVVAFTAPGR
jgi:protocatechuate 3,4-dioxygenase beta subunit